MVDLLSTLKKFSVEFLPEKYRKPVLIAGPAVIVVVLGIWLVLSSGVLSFLLGAGEEALQETPQELISETPLPPLDVDVLENEHLRELQVFSAPCWKEDPPTCPELGRSFPFPSARPTPEPSPSGD